MAADAVGANHAIPSRSAFVTVLAAILVVLPVLIGAYAYVVYPLLLRIAATRDAGAVAPIGTPFVSIVLAAYNEEAQIAGAIESLLKQDFPADRRQILVVSDCSSDRTDDIVRAYAARGVELLRVANRGGKTAAENAAVALIRGEIVVNTDASVRLHPTAVRKLVEAMADPAVGVASSRNVSVIAESSANGAEAGYVDYDMRVRSLETRAGGIIGASGAGYAIRAALHRHRVREDLSRDFSAALTAQRFGFRAVLVDDAICQVPRTASLRREYRRKVRTMSRGMETLYFNRDLLNPFVHGLFAWKLFSHKLCRWLFSVSAIPALFGLILLAARFPQGRWLVGFAFAALLLAFIGANWPDDRALPRWLPTAVLGGLAANLAAVHSAWRFFHGHEDHVWEPTRRAAAPT